MPQHIQRNLIVVVLLVAHLPSLTAVVAPRLAGSPFPVSQQPSAIWVYNLTDASYDERVLALSAVGVVAQREPNLATVDDKRVATGPGSDLWHLQLLPVSLKWEHDLAKLMRKFMDRGDIQGYIFCSTAELPGSDNGSMHIAIGLAGILQAVVVTASTIAVAKAAGLKEVLDVRTWSLEETFAKYKSQYSRTLLFNQPHGSLTQTTDLAVYGKAFALCDATLTMPLSHHALSRLDATSFVLGWGSEVDFVTSASRYGHQVLCSDHTVNVPVYSNFAPLPHVQHKRKAACPSASKQHTVAFMFTDGDSITWDLGQFASPSFDWWGQFDARAKTPRVPIAWTFQPLLQELHPHFLHWVAMNATRNDQLLAGPSGAGYTYIDQYPAQYRQKFADWTAANMRRAPLLNMINQIQLGVYNATLEAEVVGVEDPPEAIFVDEEIELTIKGSAYMLGSTVVTSRRHALSKTFGDYSPDALVQVLNSASRDPSSTDSYSIIGVEVWGYGIHDIIALAAKLDSGVRVLAIDEYIACLREHVLHQQLFV